MTATDQVPPVSAAAATGGRRVGLASVALWSTYLASVSIPWNAVKLGVRPGDFFLLIALMCFFLLGLDRRLPSLPRWVTWFAGVIIAVAFLHELFPVGPAYLSQRDVLVTSFVDRGLVTGNNLVVALKFMVSVIGLPLMFVFARLHDSRAIVRSAMAYVIGTAISATIGFGDVEGLTSLSSAITHIGAAGGRAPGLTAHPNYLAMTCVFSVPLVLWRLRDPKLYSRLWSSAGLLLLALGLYSSGSRAGAVVGVGVALLTFAILPQYRRVMPTVALVLVGIAALAFVLKPSLGAGVLKAVRLKGDDSSAAGSDVARNIVNDQGLRDFRHSPLDGVGLQVAGEAHNVYLQAMAAGGVLLLVGYLLFLAGALGRTLRMVRHQPLAMPLFVSILGGALFNYTENALTERIVFVPIALAAALPPLLKLHDAGDDQPYSAH